MESLSIPSFETVEQCHSSNYGESLLKLNGEATNTLNPQHYFIPWVTFNDVWKKEEFEAALDNLQSLLCTTYLQNMPECQ